MNIDRQSPNAGTSKEESAFVQTRRVALSGVLLLLSILAFILYGAGTLYPLVAMEFLGVSILVLLLSLLPRLFSFRRQTTQLLKVGHYRKAADLHGRELGKALAMAVSIVFLLLAPFFLTLILDPVTWILVVTASISGYAASDLLFVGYVTLWQRTNAIAVRRYKLWTIGADRKKILLESGIRQANR